MLPKLLLIINLFTMKMVLSQSVYGSAPTNTYSSTAVSSAPGCPFMLSPPATSSTTLPTTTSDGPVSPATLVSKSGVPASCVYSSVSASNVPASSLPVSPSTGAIAYFLPGPILGPKVTILPNMHGLGGNPKVSITNPKVVELNRPTDPVFIEVMGKFCEPQNTNHRGDIKNPMLPVVKENTVSPAKRLTMACSDSEPTVGVESLSYLQNQHVCPGISKTDLVLEGKINNPIEYEGLLNSFFAYLEI